MSKDKRSLYPDYDVLDYKDEWDSNTRTIVLKRLDPPPQRNCIKFDQEAILNIVASHLTFDHDPEIFAWIITYIDDQLTKEIGESQRKPTTPPEKQLILEGLKALDHWAQKNYHQIFSEASTENQFEILKELQLGNLPVFGFWQKSTQKDLFTKLAGMIITAYYSHPQIWSQIGYGGPAYPRGYIRVEKGLADPWEAQVRRKENQEL